MADNEDTLASTPRRKLMSPASLISYREEQSRNERFHSVLPYKFYPGGKNYKGQNQTFLKIFLKNDLLVSITQILNMQGEMKTFSVVGR